MREKLAGRLTYVGYTDGIYPTKEAIHVALTSPMKEAFDKVEGKTFPIIAGHTKLTFELLLSRGKLCRRQIIVDKTIEFAANKS